jgi:hypothetical protein
MARCAEAHMGYTFPAVQADTLTGSLVTLHVHTCLAVQADTFTGSLVTLHVFFHAQHGLHILQRVSRCLHEHAGHTACVYCVPNTGCKFRTEQAAAEMAILVTKHIVHRRSRSPHGRTGHSACA